MYIKGGPLPNKPIPALAGRTIRCLLFDLGDTLWSRKDMAVWQQQEGAANLRAVAVLHKLASPVSLPAISENELGHRLRYAVEERLRVMIRQNPDLEPSTDLAVVQVLQQWGILNVTRTDGEAIFEAMRVRIPTSRPLFDDVLFTLRTLKLRGFLLGIVSNRHWGGKLFQEDLQTLGLLEFFDPRHMAISIDLGIRKPNPAIFLHTLNALNVAPEQAVMVGDSLLSDIVGGKLLGLFTVWKPKPSVSAHAHLIATGSTTSASASSRRHTTSIETPTSNRPDDLPEGLHITDDDYVLAHVQSHAGQWDEHLPQAEVKPDLIIENLSDLLEVFIEVGEVQEQ